MAQRMACRLMDGQTKGALLVMAAGFCWGTFGIITKFAYAATTLGPLTLAWLRLVPALPIMALVVLAKGYRVSWSRREVGLFAAFGFCSITIFEGLYFTSFAYTTVQHAAALLYTAPAFVALLSWLVLREVLSKAKLLAVGLSILGAFLMLGVVEGGDLFGSRTRLGDWLAVASGLAYSSWYIFGKILGRNREPAVTSLLAMSFGLVFLTPIMISFEGFNMPDTLLGWQLVALIAVIPTALAYLLYLAGLKLIEATRASVFAIVEPVAAAALAFLIFQETLSYDSLLGFVLIISSIVLISKT